MSLERFWGPLVKDAFASRAREHTAAKWCTTATRWRICACLVDNQRNHQLKRWRWRTKIPFFFWEGVETHFWGVETQVEGVETQKKSPKMCLRPIFTISRASWEPLS